MADSPDLTHMLQRAVQLNARLYKGWIDLSVDYMRGLAEIFSGDMSAASGSAPAQAENESGMDSGAVVLEAKQGELARGAFLVTNDLGRTLSCELISREFSNRSGARVRADVSFDPAKFELAPGQQHVVQVAVKMDERLDPGVAYTGDFAIRGLDGYTVPAVLRRTHAPTSPIAAVAAQEAERTAGTKPTTTARSKKTGARATRRGAKQQN